MIRAVAIAVTLVLGVAYAGVSRGQTAGDGVVAIVNGDAIPGAYMTMFYESLPARYRQLPMETLYSQLLDGLVDRKLLAQAARDAGLMDDDAVRQRLAYAEEAVLQQSYLDQIIGAEITEERLHAAYDELVATQTLAEEVHARHIPLDNEADAMAVIAELAAGAGFAELAQQRSTGPSGPSGGDLGYFTRDQMVPAFAEAAFALSPGAITTAPVRTQFGWHVIKVEDRRTQAAPSFEDSLADLRDQAVQTTIIDTMQRLHDASVIRRFDAQGVEIEAPAAASDGATAE